VHKTKRKFDEAGGRVSASSNFQLLRWAKRAIYFEGCSGQFDEAKYAEAINRSILTSSNCKEESTEANFHPCA